MSLTAMNSLITVVTIPVLVPFFLHYFMGETVAAQVNALNLSLGIVMITIPPMAAGMAVKKQAPRVAKNSESAVRKGTLVFLVFLASFAFYNERQLFVTHYEAFFLIAVCLCFQGRSKFCVS
ncbi:MAG: hypothetical protein HUN05_21870 [Desulfobacter sp.]|nr:MAG: hypothetical protein HUN05_21870 [Desulfobacter sp.]